MKRTVESYKDIINLPHHVSDKHPHMSIHDRAAQFAPFAALTGHGEAINETARTVDSKIVLGEDAIQEISEKLNYIQNHIKDRQTVIITYFVPDSRKNYGGRYVTTQVIIKRIDDISQSVVCENGAAIQLEDISDIDIIR
ncbi:MAG: hypothetical protein IJ362_05640 [Oscillospiraceae bacterium]|nr:hypothetical protein [Oscillospiraceae bacterium]